MGFIDTTREWVRRIKRDAMTLWFARSHPETPWYARAMGAFVVAYALSPIDLIPDFIPVLGYVDDVILLPVLIWLTVRKLPASALEESRLKAEQWMEEQRSKPRSLVGAVVIVLIWLVVGVVLLLWAVTALGQSGAPADGPVLQARSDYRGLGCGPRLGDRRHREGDRKVVLRGHLGPASVEAS